MIVAEKIIEAEGEHEIVRVSEEDEVIYIAQRNWLLNENQLVGMTLNQAKKTVEALQEVIGNRWKE